MRKEYILPVTFMGVFVTSVITLGQISFNAIFSGRILEALIFIIFMQIHLEISKWFMFTYIKLFINKAAHVHNNIC